MPQFQPDQCTFGDAIGYGAWDIGHMREHEQFVQVLSQRTPPVVMANYDFLSLLTAGGSRRAQLEQHQTAHNLLNQITGTTSIDFSEVDLNSQDDFYAWLGYHSTTHAQIRQFLGIV